MVAAGTRDDCLADWGEFAFIDFLARHPALAQADLEVGIGDDASVWRPPAGARVLTTLDMLVEGVHFDLASTSAADLGWKALAVNLSDLAAMGGRPECVYLGLGLPPATAKAWLKEFIDAFLRLAECYRVRLAGGDTVRAGELVISVTLVGSTTAAPGLRSGASPGDGIYCSGTIGDSCLGLRVLDGRLAGLSEADAEFLKKRHRRPNPRLALGRKLVAAGVASAMIDISDGVVADLGHLLKRSGGLGAELESGRLPFSAPARRVLESGRVELVDLMTGGEDFELLFTAPPSAAAEIAEIAAFLELPVAGIGRVVGRAGISLAGPAGKIELKTKGGYDHFQSQNQ